MKLSPGWIKCGDAEKGESAHPVFCNVTQLCVSWYEELIITGSFLVILARGLQECTQHSDMHGVCPGLA